VSALSQSDNRYPGVGTTFDATTTREYITVLHVKANIAHRTREPDCGTSRGKLTKSDNWEQPDLANEPRKSGEEVLGTWEDQIVSFQCFWTRGTEEPGSLLESTDAHKGVLDTSNESALVNETSLAKDLEIRAPSTHDNDRLVSVATWIPYH
jgi:hypothetical protein